MKKQISLESVSSLSFPPQIKSSSDLESQTKLNPQLLKFSFYCIQLNSVSFSLLYVLSLNIKLAADDPHISMFESRVHAVVVGSFHSCTKHLHTPFSFNLSIKSHCPQHILLLCWAKASPYGPSTRIFHVEMLFIEGIQLSSVLGRELVSAVILPAQRERVVSLETTMESALLYKPDKNCLCIL